jgi:hypothetical protein
MAEQQCINIHLFILRKGGRQMPKYRAKPAPAAEDAAIRQIRDFLKANQHRFMPADEKTRKYLEEKGISFMENPGLEKKEKP